MLNSGFQFTEHEWKWDLQNFPETYNVLIQCYCRVHDKTVWLILFGSPSTALTSTVISRMIGQLVVTWHSDFIKTSN